MNRETALTRSQLRMWFMQAMNPRRTDLTIACAARLTAPIGVEELQRRLLPVVEANPLLSATVDAAGEPVWRSLPPHDAVRDAVRPGLRAANDGQLRSLYAEFTGQAWDLGRELPWSVCLVTTPEATYLCCRFHHLVCDGDRSLELFLAGLDDGGQPAAAPELGELLAEPPLPPDAAAEVTRLTSAITKAGNLRRRVVEPESGGHRWSGTLEPDPHGEPDAVTLLKRLRTATAPLVPDEQLLVAIPFDGCTPGQDRRIGYFGNPGIAVLGSDDGPDDESGDGPDGGTARPWADGEYERAQALSGVPFQLVMADEGFRKVADPDHPFDVLLVPRTLFTLRGDLVGAVSEPAVSRTPYALVVNHWRDRDGRLRVALESTVVGPEVLAHLGAQLLGTPGEPAAEAPAARPDDTDVLARFAAVAGARPDAVAIDVPGTGTVSYGQLWSHASALAHFLGRRLPPGHRVVAVTGAKHPAEIACVLGVHLAGATVLRLDRGRAAARRALSGVDGVGAVIRLPGEALQSVRRREDEELIEGPFGAYRVVVGAHGTAPEPEPEAPLYITLTSGTTGQPKPIPFPRAEFNALIAWHLRTFPAPRRMLQFSKLSFDIAYHVIYATLCGGGTLVAGDEGAREDPRRLLELLGSAAVEKVYLPTVLLRPVAESALAAGLPTPELKEVFVAGGALQITPEIRAWFGRTRARLVNLYGMSETQDVTSHQLTGPPEDWPDRPPVGLPVDGVRVRVVGGHDTDLPATLSGAVVVRLGSREIVTGDVGYTDRDGRLHILGRDSRVIKQRGFRVNLEALEAETSAAAGVADAVAVHYPLAAGSAKIAVLATKQDPSAELDPGPIRDRVAGTLGDGYEFELFFVPSLPRLANFKPDLREITKLAKRLGAAPADGTPAGGGDTTGSAVLAAVRELTGNPDVTAESRFLDAGLDSISLMSLAARLGRDHPGLSVADFFRHPVIGDLQRALDGPTRSGNTVVRRAPDSEDDVAVVGLAARFPGAPDAATFWRNLLDGTSAVAAPEPDGTFVRAQGHLADVDRFDRRFFGISPAEARRMDPQLRVFLELCWTALEDAGEVEGLEGKHVGVFAGAGLSTYLLNEVEPRRLAGDETPFLEHNTLPERLGTDRNYLTSTVSYRLGLTGPSVVVQAACATSLTAVHVARRALLAGECDLALAGGVSIIYPQPEGYEYVDGSVRSRHGVCRPFDKDADGTVFGNGAGVVVLKRATDARTGENTVYAEIAGSATNHDGSVKGSFSAPNPESQTRLIDTALGTSDPAVDFVEAHGTGTAIGDVIEWNGLLASRLSGPGEAPCLVGSVKGHVGHLDEAAGVAGFIKACLAVRYRLFPGTYGFSGLHPDLAGSGRFTVTGESHKLPDDRPVRGGVSSFGMGGANCHVVVRSPAPVRDTAAAETLDDRTGPLYLPVSGRSRDSFDELARRLGERLGHEAGQLPAAGVVRTLTEGRRHFAEHRGVLVHGDGTPRVCEVPAASVAGETVWAFPGQGSGFSWDVVAELGGWPVFATRFPALLDAFAERLGPDVFDRHVGRRAGDPARPVDPAGGACGDPCTIREQVLQFSFQLALAGLLRSFGCAPDVVTGHSLGEITAAVCADLLTEPDAVALVAARCVLMDSASGGFMAQARCTPDRARELAAELDLDVAAVNGPAQVVLAGDESQLAALRRAAAAADIHLTPLPVGKPFHSRLMAEAADRLGRAVPPLEARSPAVAFVGSNAAYATAPQPPDLRYWTTQLTSPVDFHAAAGTILRRSEHPPLVVEIGFSSTLSRLVRAAAAAGTAPEQVAELKKSVPGYLGKLAAARYRAGRPLDWGALDRVPAGGLIPLPSYPFDREEIRPQGPVARRGPLAETLSADVPFTLSPSEEDWIRGHRVGARWVVPAAGILRLFAKIGRSVRPEATDVLLADVSFERPVTFETETEVVEARVSVDSRSPAECVLWTRRPGQDWTRNAAALLTDETRTVETPDEPGEPADPEGFYRRFERQGLSYGPAYHGLAEITVGETAASAAWRPAGPGGPHTRLGIGAGEVAAVDGVLQLADVLDGGGDADIRMPAHVAWARLRAVPDPATRVTVAKGRTTAAGTLTGETGDVLAELDGVRFQTVRPDGEVAYRLGWRAHVPVGGELPDAVAAALDETRTALSAPDEEVVRYQERIRELENHAVRVLDTAGGRDYLTRAGGDTTVAARRLKAFERLLDRPAAEVEKTGATEAVDAEWSIVRNCAGLLPRFFDGSLDGENILFGGSGPDLLRTYYQRSFLLNRLNTALAGVLASLASAQSPRPLKVLEVGGGTGASTEGVLAALDELGASADYTFTDLSEGLTRLAGERFGHRPGFRTATADLDSDESVAALGDGYDVVVAVDVIHATRDVGRTLDRLAGRLAPHGTLLLVEDLKALAWVDLTFGLLDSWWSFDDDIRTDHPLLTGERWDAVLRDRFARVDLLRACGGLSMEDVAADEGLFVCANPLAAGQSEPAVVDVAPGVDVADRLSHADDAATVVLRFGLGDLDADTAEWYAAALLQAVRRAEEVPGLATLVLATPDGAGDLTPAGSMAAALARIAASEDRRVRTVSLAVDGPVPAEETARQVRTLLTHRASHVNARISGGRLLLPAVEAVPPAAADEPPDHDALVVFGARSDLAHAVTDWFVTRHGVRRVWLVSRSAPDEATGRFAARLADSGADVACLTADVGDFDDVRAVAERVRTGSAKPLVLNLAAVLRDGTIDGVGDDDLAAVLRPKVRGSHHIREAFAGTGARLVLFSSTSVLLGNAGQAAHGMACAYLDGLAAGPGVSSVQWGPWDGVGITARLGLNDDLRRAGERPAPPAVLLPELDRACRTGGVAIAADLGAPALRRHPFRTAMLPARPDDVPAPDAAPRPAEAIAPGRPGPGDDVVRWAVASVLGVAAGELAADRSLADNGVDSLDLIEVRAAIERESGLRVPLNDLSDAPTLAEAAEALGPRATPAATGTGTVFYVAGIFGRLDGAPDLESALPGGLVTLASPTRAAGEAGRTDVVEVALDLAGQVERAQPEGDLTLVGHSFGAMVAYSLAVELRRRGRTLRRLVLVDGEPVGGPAADTSGEAEFTTLLDLGGGAGRLSGESRASAYETYLANCEIARSPQVVEDLGCPVVIAVPETATGVGLPAARAAELAAEAREKLGGTSVDLVRIPGDHFSMLRSPHATRLAELIQ
ncbi:type I polyketide synthase [Amycolatopsis balhimycina]|nr:type I polyketide synthase [Amycolatopsis balhimycina]